MEGKKKRDRNPELHRGGEFRNSRVQQLCSEKKKPSRSHRSVTALLTAWFSYWGPRSSAKKAQCALFKRWPWIIYFKYMFDMEGSNSLKIHENCILLWYLDFPILSSFLDSCSVSQLCPTLCDPTDCSTPGLPCPSLSSDIFVWVPCWLFLLKSLWFFLFPLRLLMLHRASLVLW